MHGESARQILHVAMAAFALLLRWLTWPQAALCAILALTHNLVVLPRTGKLFYRDHEHERGFSLGMTIYPVTVLALILLFRERLYLAAGLWGVLAFGDGFATLIGKRFGRTQLPWNAAKSVEGSLAYVLSGGLACWALMLWAAPNTHYATADVPGVMPLLALSILAAVIAAGVESLDLPVDDNLSAPLAAALAVYGVTSVW